MISVPRAASSAVGGQVGSRRLQPRTRRWCSMERCGNRVQLRAHASAAAPPDCGAPQARRDDDGRVDGAPRRRPSRAQDLPGASSPRPQPPSWPRPCGMAQPRPSSGGPLVHGAGPPSTDRACAPPQVLDDRVVAAAKGAAEHREQEGQQFEDGERLVKPALTRRALATSAPFQRFAVDGNRRRRARQ